MIAQAPQIFPEQKFLKLVNELKIQQTKSVSFSVYSMTEESQFLGFMFP